MNIDLLAELTGATGIASREDDIRGIVVRELKPLVDDLSVDALGNVFGVKNGDGPTVMVSAHMDEIGFLIRSIDDKGFIRLQPVGGFDPRVLVAQRVKIKTRNGDVVPGVLQPGVKPIHLMGPNDSKDLKLEDLFVDIGLPGDEAKQTVSVGDMVTLDRPLARYGDTIASKALDDRCGVYVMIEALRSMTKQGQAKIVAVASTQEEVGLRGATVASYAVEPDISVALDVTIAADIPGTPDETAVSRLRQGAAIKVFDSSHISNPKLVEHLRQIAEEHKIPHQMELLPRGGTDAGAMQKARAGSAAVTLSIPTRYVHSVNEMAAISDIDACVNLLARFLEVAGSRNYGYSIA